MVFGDSEETRLLSDLVASFPGLWEDNRFVKVPEKEWIKLELRQDWQSRVSGRAKIYPLGIKDRDIIDRTFDELHRQGRLD